MRENAGETGVHRKERQGKACTKLYNAHKIFDQNCYDNYQD